MSNRSNLSSTNPEQRHGPALAFAALDRYIEKHIVLPVETVRNEGTLVDWGTGNGYPLYLFGLYNNAPTLRSVVDGTVDFIGGDDVTCSEARWNGGKAMNRLGETPFVLVRQQALNEMLYGGRAWQIIRDRAGAVAEVYCIPLRFLRCNKDCTVFYYSEDWGVPGKRVKSVRYPSFRSDLDWATLTDEERDANASSILYAKGDIAQVYPSPCYAASVKACEMERCIDDFHLNSLNNSFTSSVLINFNNGIPLDAQKEEIERNANEKFAGYQNGGRAMFSWNDNRESQTTITPIKVEDFGARYDAVSNHSRQQIFTAFRAVPSIFGLPTASGFSFEEYEQAFRLYNRVRVRPVQRAISDDFERIYGAPVLTIVPFSLEENDGGEAVVR